MEQHFNGCEAGVSTTGVAAVVDIAARPAGKGADVVGVTSGDGCIWADGTWVAITNVVKGMLVLSSTNNFY